MTPSIRALVRELDASVAVRDLRTLADVASAASQPQRARATIVAVYAAIAMLLAVTGLGGITSYSVGRRKREFAIRAALGARGAALTRLAMRQSVAASLCGTVQGWSWRSSWRARWASSSSGCRRSTRYRSA